MFFIYGWGNRQKAIANGSFQCPVCRGRTGYTHYSQRRWFSFFFVPLFPFTSPQEFVGCHQCNNVFSLESLPASHGITRAGTSVSGLALGAMFLAFAALVTVCVFFLSLPLSIAAVIMGHLGYIAVRRNQPYLEGGWQAITALVVGYMALFFSSIVALFFLFGPQFFPDSQNNGTGIGEFANGAGGGTFSPQKALNAAETMIATKQNLPPGRGNNPVAVRLANNYAELMKRASDEAFTKSGKPILQLSGGEYLTYCELHEDRCLFLVHVPSYRNFTDGAKETLAQIAWINAQLITADEIPAGSRLAVGLRGTILYGDIIVGRAPINTRELDPGTPGEKEDLLSFFIQDVPEANIPSESPEVSEPSREVPPELAQKPSSKSEEPPPTTSEPTVAAEPNAAAEPSAATEPSEPTEVASSNMEEEYTKEEYDNPFAPKMAQPQDAAENGMKDLSANGASNDAVDSSKETDATDSEMVSKEETVEKGVNDSLESSSINNLTELKLLTSVANESQAFSSLTFSHDGKWVVGGTMDATVMVCDAKTGTIVGKVEKLPDEPSVVSLAMGHNNRLLAGGCVTGAFFTWEVDDAGQLKEQQWTRPLENEIRKMLPSPSFGYLIAGDKEGNVTWFPFRDAERKDRKIAAFDREVASLWLPEKGTDALATDGKKLIKFSLKDGSIGAAIDLGIKYPQLAAFAYDGQQLLVADFDNVYLFNVDAGEKVFSIEIPNREQVHVLQYHPNKKWFALGLKGRTEVWDLRSRKVLARANSGSSFYDKLVAFSDDGTKLAVASDSEKEPIRIYELGEITQ